MRNNIKIDNRLLQAFYYFFLIQLNFIKEFNQYFLCLKKVVKTCLPENNSIRRMM